MKDNYIQKQIVKISGLDLLENGVMKERLFLCLLCCLEDSKNSIWMEASHGNFSSSFINFKKIKISNGFISIFLITNVPPPRKIKVLSNSMQCKHLDCYVCI